MKIWVLKCLHFRKASLMRISDPVRGRECYSIRTSDHLKLETSSEIGPVKTVIQKQSSGNTSKTAGLFTRYGRHACFRNLPQCSTCMLLDIQNGGAVSVRPVSAQGSNSVRNVAEINNTQATEDIPVVSRPIHFVSSAHPAVKKNLT